jgi:hypothetical protein
MRGEGQIHSPPLVVAIVESTPDRPPDRPTAASAASAGYWNWLHVFLTQSLKLEVGGLFSAVFSHSGHSDIVNGIYTVDAAISHPRLRLKFERDSMARTMPMLSVNLQLVHEPSLGTFGGSMV